MGPITSPPPDVIILCDPSDPTTSSSQITPSIGGAAATNTAPTPPPSPSSVAGTIATILTDKFSIPNVTIRSLTTPIGTLLSTIQSTVDKPTLFVILNHPVLPPPVYTPGPVPLTWRNSPVLAHVACVTETIESNSTHPIYEPPPTNTPETTALAIARVFSLSSPTVQKSVSRHLASTRQASYVADAQLRTQSPRYQTAIGRCYDYKNQITGSNVQFLTTTSGGGTDSSSLPPPERMSGKVRDRYDLGDKTDKLALVTTDRQSGFDRQLALVPYKGAVLNLTSAFWFDKTKHIIPNHLICVPHPNVSIVKKCNPFPIEFVVRAYVTGSTSTSIWKNYQNGVRNYCGHTLPEGLQKNQKLWKNLLTPTTKEEEHDRPISSMDIVSENFMSQTDLDVCSKAAMELFALGQQIASEHGLILVDTKYEFGKDPTDGTIHLIDEIHTPDSSRYWLASSYETRIHNGLEPENIDKEFLRLWFRERCDPYNKDEILPDAPKELVVELSRRYVSLYEMITGKEFVFDDGTSGEDKIAEAILNNL